MVVEVELNQSQIHLFMHLHYYKHVSQMTALIPELNTRQQLLCGQLQCKADSQQHHRDVINILWHNPFVPMRLMTLIKENVILKFVFQHTHTHTYTHIQP